MVKPPAVRPPALLGLCAPASPVRREFVEAGVKELESQGFSVRLGASLFERDRYTAGNTADRARDFLDLWKDPEVSGIFCARGGYGSMHLLAELPSELFREQPKVVVGSSDITALHAFLMARSGLVTFHGPMVAQQIARGFYDVQSLISAIGQSSPPPRLDPAGIEVLHEGAAEGIVLGGCLSMVVALLGTPYLPSLNGSVLFLEDTLVKPYQLDRMLTQLALAGALDEVRAIVFGQMPHCEQHPDQGYTLPEMLRDLTGALSVPVLFGLPSGHTTTPGLTLPLGVRARVDSSGLTLLEGAVS